MEILLPQLDRHPMRRAIAGMVPGVTIAVQRLVRRVAFFRHQPLERGEPMQIISLAGVGIAGVLRALDLGGERCRPFGPRE